MKIAALKDIPQLKRRLQDLTEEMKVFDGYSAVCFGEVRGGGSGSTDGRMISMIERRDCLRKTLEQVYQQYIQALEESMETLETINEVKMRNIFTARYVHEKTWNQVAQTIGGRATADSVKKMHDRYLSKIGEEIA